MDGRSEWVEKGGSRSCPDKTIMERIMLRFRPIAPKPAVGEPVHGSEVEGESRGVVIKERKKRKYVRVKETRCKKDKKKEEVKSENTFDFELWQSKISGLGGLSENGSSKNLDFKVEGMFPGWTKLDNKSGENSGVESENMQPKISEFGRFNESGSSINLDFKVVETIPGSMKLDKKDEENNGVSGGGGVVDRMAEKVVESWVMVEGVRVMNDIWFGEGGLGSTDIEKKKNLEMDVCPGLISDGFDRIQWVNLAYRKLVDPVKDDEESSSEVVAWLVVKEKLPVVYKAFASTVRVVYSCWNNRDDNKYCNNRNKKYISQTMPCDVWKMDFGGFAWRLDSKAALSLGR